MDTVTSSVAIFTEMISQIDFRRHRMRQEADRGFTTATDLAEYLVEKGFLSGRPMGSSAGSWFTAWRREGNWRH